MFAKYSQTQIGKPRRDERIFRRLRTLKKSTVEYFRQACQTLYVVRWLGLTRGRILAERWGVSKTTRYTQAIFSTHSAIAFSVGHSTQITLCAKSLVCLARAQTGDLSL